MSHTRKTTKKESSTKDENLYENLFKRLEGVSSTIEKVGAPLKNGIISTSKPLTQPVLTTFSAAAKLFNEKLVPIENQSKALLNGFATINAEKQTACILGLENALNAFKEGRKQLITQFNGAAIPTIDTSTLDEVKTELDSHQKNIKKLSKPQQDALGRCRLVELNLRKSISEINDITFLMLEIEAGKKSPEFVQFNSRIETIENNINALKFINQPKNATVSVTTQNKDLYSEADKKAKTAGDQAIKSTHSKSKAVK